MTPRNHTLLASLPEDEYKELLPKLKLVSLTRGQILFDVMDITEYFYFPVGAVVSMLNDFNPDEAAELHMLGKTCIVGGGAIDVPSFYQAKVTIPGLAYSLRASDLRKLRQESSTFVVAAWGSQGLLMSHIIQRITCIKFHSIEQQFIRWVLLMLDRMYESTIAITHAELAKLIGCSREMLNGVLGGLAKQGHLALRRGKLEVLNRPALELLSCDCYWHARGKEHPKLGNKS